MSKDDPKWAQNENLIMQGSIQWKEFKSENLKL